MAELILLEQLHAYLIAQGVGQAPNADPSLTVPSIWMAPRDGAKLPRDGENITVTLVDTMLRAPSSLEEWMTETFVDIIVRSRNPTPGKLLQRQIHKLIVPWGSVGGRKMWTMGAILVECSTEWRGDQPLPERQSVLTGDPHVTYDRVQSFKFDVRRKILAGLTIP